jgi:hypothetical protein
MAGRKLLKLTKSNQFVYRRWNLLRRHGSRLDEGDAIGPGLIESRLADVCCIMVPVQIKSSFLTK